MDINKSSLASDIGGGGVKDFGDNIFFGFCWTGTQASSNLPMPDV